jgi:hypothetical protein
MDLLNIEDRKLVLKQIKSDGNKARKALSKKMTDVFEDRQAPYVKAEIGAKLSEKTVAEMTIVNSLNIAKRVVSSEASLYDSSPLREFKDLSGDQAQALRDIYSEHGYNARFGYANELYKLKQQIHLYWQVKHQELRLRVLDNHYLDVVTDPDDPEKALAYIITISPLAKSAADESDAEKLRRERYVVWSAELNFIMNGVGEIVSGDETVNVTGKIPIIEISEDKKGTYWVEPGQSVVDFSIQANVMTTDIWNVVRMQGWGQAVYTGPEGSLPEEFTVGPNHIIRIPVDPLNPTNSDFRFVSASPDLAGSLAVFQAIVSAFLSSRGINPGKITFDGTKENFSSGIERLFAMIEEFKASSADISTFVKAEQESFDVVRAILNTYSQTDVIGDKLSLGTLPEQAYMSIEYAEPQMIKTEKEQLDQIEQELRLGMTSHLKAYMRWNDVDEATAVKEIAEILLERKRVQDAGILTQRNDVNEGAPALGE